VATDAVGDATGEIVAVEHERCRLINAGEWEALAALLAEELTFVHSNGVIEDKAQWIANVKKPRRYFFRDAIEVKSFGDVAITTGGLIHVFLDDDGAPTRVLPVAVLQVWVKRDGGWKLFANQHTRVPVTR
jgi:ketosteroid isomerase-like protein